MGRRRLTVYLCGGGFPAFFYHLGYVLGARRQGVHVRCCGVSGGALAAWVLGHRDVSFETVRAAAHLVKRDRPFAFLDTYVACFMDNIKRTCGPFVPELYTGSYSTAIGSLTSTLIRTSDIESDVRASCFVPVLSGAFSKGGRIDGCLSVWSDPPFRTEYVVIPGPALSPFCLLPLLSHASYYSGGYRDGTANANAPARCRL